MTITAPPADVRKHNSDARETDCFSADYWQIAPLTDDYDGVIQQRIEQKTKPPGSLGQLELLAAQLAKIHARRQSAAPLKLAIQQPRIVVFAADHGIAQHNISIAPSAVTTQMVHNFLAGGAAINCFCTTNNIALTVVDAGIAAPVTAQPLGATEYLQRRVGNGTQDFSQRAAMTLAECCRALEYGAAVVREGDMRHSNCLGFGDMGIGNTSSAAALVCALTGLSAAQVTGLGTGISAQQLELKTQLIAQGLERARTAHGLQHSETFTPQQALCEVGGFEIGQLVGAVLAAAQAGQIIVVDGFIVSTAALIASAIAPNCREYMVFAHESAERAYQHILDALQATPLLNLSLRLGEGSGAALALPLLRAAVAFYNDMASLDTANVVLQEATD